MAEEAGQERTERATAKHEYEARQKGQIPRSRELNTAVLLIVSALGLIWFGEGMLTRLTGLMVDNLKQDRARVFDPDALVAGLSAAGGTSLWVILPFSLLLLLAVLCTPAALGGWAFSMEVLTLDLNRLNPINGLKRLFAWRGLVELVKSIAKFALVLAVSMSLYGRISHEVLSLGGESLEVAMGHAGHLCLWVFLMLSTSLILIAAVDVPFQLWDHAQKLKMTKQAVKEESKDMEGKPEVKGKIRSLQREVARRRMMEQVPKADVIVTNPTHFAVALRYQQDKWKAPRVIAKGADLVAARIREVAGEHRIPMLSAPPLARALFFSTDIDEEIPAGLYMAVAQVLAYVYQLKTARTYGGLEPVPPADLPVPEDLQRPGRH